MNGKKNRKEVVVRKVKKVARKNAVGNKILCTGAVALALGILLSGTCLGISRNATDEWPSNPERIQLEPYPDNLGQHEEEVPPDNPVWPEKFTPPCVGSSGCKSDVHLQ